MVMPIIIMTTSIMVNMALSRLFQKNENIYFYIYFFVKSFIAIFSGFFAYYIRFNSWQLTIPYELLIFIFAVFIFTTEIITKKENFYNYSLFQFLQKDVLNFIYAIIIIIIIGVLFKFTEIYSRLWFGIFITTCLFLHFINKLIFNFYHKKVITRSKFFVKNVMIVGSASECQHFFKNFRNKRYNLKLACIKNPSQSEKQTLNIPHIYLEDNLAFNIKYQKLNQVWIIASNEYSRLPLIEKFANIPIDIITVENTIGISDYFMEKIGNFSLYQTSFTPFYGEAYALKLFVDFILSSFALILLSPIFLIVSIIILIEDGRPIIFSQMRHGWDGHHFKIYKFRSLKNQNSTTFKQVEKNDKRYLRSGRILRKLSIDELPQLFNVLKGDMSLVGPRPHALAHNDEFALKLRGFMQRHRCKPGITGLAQVNGFRGVTDTTEKMKKRYEYDLKYIENWSFLLDIKIIFKTAFVFLFQDAD